MSKAWPQVQLGKVLTERQERPKADDLLTGRIRIIEKIGFNDGQIQIRTDFTTKTGMILVRPGDFVVSGINAAKGAIAIYAEENKAPVAATIHYGCYIPNKKSIDIKFLWWMLRSRFFRELLFEYVPGGIKTELKAKRLLPIPIPLPSLDEQRRILARIEELSAKIEEAKALRGQAAEELAMLSHRVIDGLITYSAAKHEPLSSLLMEPMRNGLSVPATQLGSGIVFAKVGVVNTGVFDPRETKLVAVNLPPDSPYWLRKDDIVVSRGNTIDLVGRAAVYKGDPPECAIPDLLIRIRVQRDRVDPQYVAAFFHSAKARAYIESQIAGTSSTMPKISQPKLAAMSVPVPHLAEQRRIVAEMAVLQAEVDKVKRLQAETAAELDALLPSILDKAFKGEL